MLLDRELVPGTDSSTLSRFADDHWRFNEAVFEQDVTSIRVNFALVPAPLRLAAKHYMWQMLNHVAMTPTRRTAAKRPSPRSISTRFSMVKDFLIWLDGRAVTFIVAASVTGGPDSGTPNPGFETSSDGILVGAVWYPSDAGKKCSALINGYADGIGWVWATGGNTVVHQNTWGSTMWSNANTFAIPVRKGTSFTGNVNQLSGREVDAPTGFWWVPFGRNATLAEMSAAEATALGLELPEPPQPETPTDYDPSTAIAEIVEVIKELAGGAIPDPAERELTVALRSLVMHQP